MTDQKLIKAFIQLKKSGTDSIQLIIAVSGLAVHCPIFRAFIRASVHQLDNLMV